MKPQVDPTFPRPAFLSRWTVALPILILGAFLASMMVHLAYRGELYLTYFVDDFYYYLVVARNLAFHGASTFNGIQLTNGYHPFWLLTIALLYRVFGIHLTFFVALILVIWLLVCAGYVALRHTQRSLGIGDDLGLVCALLSVTLMAVVSRSGMEVSLALFCLMLFYARTAAQPLERQMPRAAFVSGLLASAIVLSRIDTCLVVAAYGVLTLIRPVVKRRAAVERVLWFSAGLFPVIVYCAVNWIVFGTVLPISGIAKNLKQTWLPSASSVRILALPRPMNVLFTWPAAALCLLFIVHLIHRSVRPDDWARLRVQLCVALHPIVFYILLSFSGDWPMWWIWYLYPVVPVWAILGPVVLERWVPVSRVAALWSAGAVACVSLVVILDRVPINMQAVYPLQRAIAMQQFAVTHPGRYGIGDAAGLAAYLMPVPVLQLEGLMADKSFVARIRRREPLLQALRELDVDYYVTIRAQQDGGCYDVREPAQAGRHSPVMQGRLCSKPIAEIHPQGDPNHVLIFDVRKLRVTQTAGL
jgi:hypothetical protein